MASRLRSDFILHMHVRLVIYTHLSFLGTFVCIHYVCIRLFQYFWVYVRVRVTHRGSGKVRACVLVGLH